MVGMDRMGVGYGVLLSLYGVKFSVNKILLTNRKIQAPRFLSHR